MTSSTIGFCSRSFSPHQLVRALPGAGVIVGAAVGWVVTAAGKVDVDAVFGVEPDVTVEPQPAAKNAVAVAIPIVSSRFMKQSSGYGPARLGRWRSASFSR